MLCRIMSFVTDDENRLHSYRGSHEGEDLRFGHGPTPRPGGPRSLKLQPGTPLTQSETEDFGRDQY